MSTEEVIKSIEAIQADIELVQEETRKKQIEIEKKYNTKLQDQFNKRDEIIAKSNVESFWRQVLTAGLIELIGSSKDQAVLDALVDLKATTTYSDNLTTKTIVFTFKTNELFSNKTLKKVLTIDESNDELKLSGEKVLFKNEKKVNKSTDKKRKDSDSEESFILLWIESEDNSELDIFETIVKAYQDPFQALTAGDDDDMSYDDEDDEDEDDEEEEEVEVAPTKKVAKKAATGKKN
ncbi:nucleosome assembly family protein [Cavenderia fasciculata]|uniref:Nucleosome assembly family protein n=1 Tax=Cavenderia fasciculata TaxID=261658 RepID=F4QBX0_CACFS|nr:nucleosome assembly family protein [Cavenderia fasciculata]EGG14708.1 nucleosome assembly family protein [Cavenderia fasciculata]|eukprot:XP_004351216.1 nucleosome assembly family protein [Cavenderia fasciculata]